METVRLSRQHQQILKMLHERFNFEMFCIHKK